MNKFSKYKLLGGSLATGVLIFGTSGITNAQTPEECFIFDINTKTITSYSQSIDCPREVEIPAQINGVDVEVIGPKAFYRANLKSLTFDSNSKIHTVEESGFNGNTLVRGDLVLPSSMRILKQAAFSETAFKNIYLNEGLTQLHTYAFSTQYRNGIDYGTIYVSSTITDIGGWSLWGPRQIEFHEDTSNRTRFIVKDNIVYNYGETNGLAASLYFTKRDNLEYTIPNIMEYKGKSYNVIPELFSSVFINTFPHSTSVNEELPDGRIVKLNIDQTTLDRKNYLIEDNLILVKSDDGQSLTVSGNLDFDRKTLHIKSHYQGIPVKAIGNLAIRQSKIENVIIDEGIEMLDVNSFYGNRIKNVTIPASAENNVILVAFRNNLMENITLAGYTGNDGYIGKTGYGWGDTKRAGMKQYFHKGVVYEQRADAPNELSISYIANGLNYEYVSELNGMKVTKIEENATSNYDYFEPTKISLEFPENIKIIERINIAPSIKEVTFPSTLETITNDSFNGGFLRAVKIPDNLTSIGPNTFASNIGEKAFGYKVVGIVSDGRDISQITNNSSNLVLVHESEYRQKVDLTPPNADLDISNNEVTIGNLQDGERALYKIVEPNDNCATTTTQAIEYGYSVYNKDSKPQLEESHNGKKLCVIAFDDSYNLQPLEEIISGVDKTPPVITVTNPTDTPANSKTYSATSNEPNTTISRVLVSPNEVCSINLNYVRGDNYLVNNEEDNGKKVCFKAEDSNGNVSYAESSTISNIDTTPPSINVSLGDNDTIKALFDDLNLKDNGEGFSYTIDNSTPTTYTNGSPVNLTEDMNGKVITFKGEDKAGNIVTKSTTINGIDQTKPELDVAINRTNQTLTPTVTDNNLNPNSLFYYLDDEPNNKIPYVSGQPIPLTEDMNGKTFTFEAEDTKGNKLVSKLSTPISGIDKTAPTINIEQSDNPQTIKATFTDINPVTGFYYFEDTPNNKIPYTSGQAIPLTEDMNGKVIVFEATDNKGNKATESTKTPFVGIDTIPPVITLNKVGQTITPTVTDENLDPSSFEYYIEGKPTERYPFENNKPVSLSEDMNGKKLVFVAKDLKKNETSKNTDILSGIDRTRPTIDITVDTKGQTVNAVIKDDNLKLDTVKYYFKDEPSKKFDYVSNTDIPLTESMNGKTIVFEAEDRDGNKSVKEYPTPFSGIDNTKPVIKLNQADKSITPTVTDDNLDEDTLVYYVEGTTNKIPYKNNGKIDLTENMNGKTLIFEAKDTKGNLTTISSTPISGIDNTNPTININRDVNSVSADMEDKSPVTGFYYFKDKPNDKTSYTSGTKIPLTGDMAGKTLVFEATDDKGNKTVKEYPLTNIDNTAPNTEISQDGNNIKVTFGEGEDNLGNTEIKYFFKDENPVTRKDYKEPFTITPEMDGKTLVIEVTDKFGNKTTKEIKLSYKVPITTSSSRGSSGSGGATIKVQNVDGSVTYYGNNKKNSSSSNSSTSNTTSPTTETPVSKSLLDTINKEAGRTYFEFNGGVYSIKDTSCNYNFTLSQDTTNGFNDVNYVQSLTDIITKFKNSGIVSGVGNNNFEPLRGITRAEFLSIILKGNCLDEVIGDKEIPFNDVRRDHWHYNVIKKAYNLGIISGYGDGTVRPQQEISRIEALAVMMKVNDLRIDKLPDNFLGHKFTDITEEWQNDLLDKVVYFKMVNDDYMKEFKPNKTILRQEVMKFLYDLFNKYVGNGK